MYIFLFLSDKNECLLKETRISVNEFPQLLVLKLFRHYICSVIVQYEELNPDNPMNMEQCKYYIEEMSKMLDHAYKSATYIEKGKDLRGEERNFEQLTRELQHNINSLKINIQHLTELDEKKQLVGLIDDAYVKYRKFDMEILEVYSRQHNEYYSKVKKLQNYENTASDIAYNAFFHDPFYGKSINDEYYIPNVSSETDTLEPMSQTEFKMRGGIFGLSLLAKLVLWRKRKKEEPKCIDIETKINNFNHITSEFRDIFKELVEIKNSLNINIAQEEERVLSEEEGCQSQDFVSSENESTTDANEQEASHRGRNKEIWTSNDLSLLDEKSLTILMMGLYNKTNACNYKQVSGINNKQYDAIWAAIAYHSAKRLGYVNEKCKPNSSSFERTIKALGLNCTRNTISDYYDYVILFLSYPVNELFKELMDLADINELAKLKENLKSINEASKYSDAKLQFFAMNHKVINSLCNQLTLLFEEEVKKKLQSQ